MELGRSLAIFIPVCSLECGTALPLPDGGLDWDADEGVQEADALLHRDHHHRQGGQDDYEGL